MSDTTYTVSVVCGNCFRQQRLTVAKGVPVDRKSCPTCGCGRLTVVGQPRLGKVA